MQKRPSLRKTADMIDRDKCRLKTKQALQSLK